MADIIRGDNGNVIGHVSEGYVPSRFHSPPQAYCDDPNCGCGLPTPPVTEPFPTDTELEPASMGLMVRLMERNAADTAAVTNRVIEDKDREISQLRHTLGCIRTKIEDACNGPFVPNPQVIIDLLYPTRQAVQRYADGLPR